MAVTAEMVGEIIQTDPTISLTPFITIAESLVTEVCGEEHDAARLDMIGTWLSAHFYTIRDNRLAGESLDFMEYGYKNQHKLGLNLQVSMYGQQVLLLDTSGGFADLNNQANNGNKKIIGVAWLGTEEE